MEVREITQYVEKTPFKGYGIWIIFELKYRKAHLLHPVHLTELMLSEYELVRASGFSLWPFNQSNLTFNKEKFVKHFKERVQLFVKLKRSFPVQTVAAVIAEFDGIEVKEALAWIGLQTKSESTESAHILFNKANREYAIRKGADLSKIKGRPAAIVEVLKANGPASIYQITHLVQGRLKTKSKLSRVVTYFVHKLTSQGILDIVAQEIHNVEAQE
jgi:hypothetical protein